MRQRGRWTVRDLRRGNSSVLLSSLIFEAPRSRRQLGEATGLSPASVSNVLRDLIDEGIVVEVASVGSDGGRPRALLQVSPDYAYSIGVDVSETRVRVELFDLAMAGRARADRRLDPGQHAAGLIVEAIVTGLGAVLAESGVDPAAVLGMGVAVPGIVGSGPDALVHGQAFGWDAVPLGRLLRAGTDLPLYIENGVKAMGQAEMWFGAGRGARNVIACLIGSGVGASIITNGVALGGATSSAGEWGHTTVMADGRECRCGSLGCLEAYVSADAIFDRYGGPLPGSDQEARLAGLIGLAPTSARAAEVLDATALYLGTSIADLINLFNPERIIIGGWAGLLLGEHMLPAIRKTACERSLRPLFARTAIGLGHLGPDSVALGAAAVPIKALLSGSLPPARDSSGPARAAQSRSL